MKAVLFAGLLCAMSLMAVSSEPAPPVGVAVFLCNEWQGIVVYVGGEWFHYSAKRITESPGLQDLLRGIELDELRLGERDFCTAFKAT